jgi:hypothetical protein
MSPDSESFRTETILAFEALDKAQEKYDQGLPGPYMLEGQYSFSVFEHLCNTENHWKLAYSEGGRQIILYGDPSAEHERISCFLGERFTKHLCDYMATAPATGQDLIDCLPPDERCMEIIDLMGSSTRVLVPREQLSKTLHPTDCTRDGTLHKGPDNLYTVSAICSAAAPHPLNLLVMEIAVNNETIAEAVWEGQRWVSAKKPSCISLTFKIEVSPSLLLECD